MTSDMDLVVDLLALATHPHDVAGAQETMRRAADRIAAFDALPADDEVERVARAIWAADGLDRNDDNGWNGQAVSEDTRNQVRAEARAAIAAMSPALPADPELEALRGRIEALEAENARLEKERAYAVKWGNTSLDSVKAVMWGYEDALKLIRDNLGEHIGSVGTVDVTIALAFETARAALSEDKQ